MSFNMDIIMRIVSLSGLLDHVIKMDGVHATAYHCSFDVLINCFTLHLHSIMWGSQSYYNSQLYGAQDMNANHSAIMNPDLPKPISIT